MSIISKIKKKLYFVAAGYFRFFAGFAFRRWHPRVIAITGSAGKTTMLNLVEFEFGSRAHYSHNANSAFGIAFDILGMDGIRGSKWRWILLILQAPIRAIYFKRTEEFYVVEIDGERPREAEFVAKWLRPEVTLWVSLGRSHAVQFEREVAEGKYPDLETAIAHEFSMIPAYTTRQVYIDADNELMRQAVAEIPAKVVELSKDKLVEYRVYPNRTDFIFVDVGFHFHHPEPKDLTIQLLMLKQLTKYLDIPLKTDFQGLRIAPGRSSYLRGQNQLKLIDSSYNAHLISMASILEMTRLMQAGPKWLVIGDMVEQGSIAEEEHRSLADLIAQAQPAKVILVGRRTQQWTAPRLKELGITAYTTVDPRAALGYIQEQSVGGETIIFKGSQYLEWIIEQLLADPSDAARLPRREKAAVMRRRKHGLG